MIKIIEKSGFLPLFLNFQPELFGHFPAGTMFLMFYMPGYSLV